MPHEAHDLSHEPLGHSSGILCLDWDGPVFPPGCYLGVAFSGVAAVMSPSAPLTNPPKASSLEHCPQLRGWRNGKRVKPDPSPNDVGLKVICFAELYYLVLSIEPVRATVIHANALRCRVGCWHRGDRLISLGTLQARQSPSPLSPRI